MDTPPKTPPKLQIWTDGACKNNPGVGGWGVLMVYGAHKKELFGGAALTTNNQMELTAVIEALKALKRPCTLELHTDSKYVLEGITKWIYGWKRKNWKNVKNVELWQTLDQLRSAHQITWTWVKGHDGDPGNERADELANMGAAQAAQSTPLTP